MKFFFILLSFVPYFAFSQSTLIYDAHKKGIDLSESDQETLEIGEISTTRYVTGGILGTYPIGFGVGHAIQGRWSQKGWIFTAGEFGSLTVLVSGLIGCMDDMFSRDDCSDVESAIIATGLIGFIGFRIWEIVDVWAAPPGHNKKFNELKNYIEKASEKGTKAALDLAPLYNPNLGQGLALRLIF